MNPKKLSNIITLYKEHFSEISNQEIYKWRAVKCFQDNWDVDSSDFPEMLNKSLRLANNLLDSGLYYPKRMVINNALLEPEKIRNLFIALFLNNKDLTIRITEFRDNFRKINEINFPGKKHFQDDRAVMVYLCLKYPKDFFLYKYTMFKKFVGLIDYTIKPIQGRVENVKIYETLCQLIKGIVEKDTELTSLHKRRLTLREYDDKNYHILTQDIIYAATNHIERFRQTMSQLPAMSRLTFKDVSVTPTENQPKLVGITGTDHVEDAKENKRIGTLGELLVVEYEKELTKNYKTNGEVIHSSQISGDGLGFDIKSFDKNGDPKFIEVKTTRGSETKPFFITASELYYSNNNENHYYLYRLHNYNEKEHSATFFIYKGSLKLLCTNPVVYKVVLKK